MCLYIYRSLYIYTFWMISIIFIYLWIPSRLGCRWTPAPFLFGKDGLGSMEWQCSILVMSASSSTKKLSQVRVARSLQPHAVVPHLGK